MKTGTVCNFSNAASHIFLNIKNISVCDFFKANDHIFLNIKNEGDLSLYDFIERCNNEEYIDTCSEAVSFKAIQDKALEALGVDNLSIKIVLVEVGSLDRDECEPLLSCIIADDKLTIKTTNSGIKVFEKDQFSTEPQNFAEDVITILPLETFLHGLNNETINLLDKWVAVVLESNNKPFYLE